MPHAINDVCRPSTEAAEPIENHLPQPPCPLNARYLPRAAPHHRLHGSAPATGQPRRPSYSGGRQSDSQRALHDSSRTGPSLSNMSHGQFSTRCRRPRPRPRAWWGQESRRAAHAARCQRERA